MCVCVSVHNFSFFEHILTSTSSTSASVVLSLAEFQPGVPWKGIQNSGDPESDHYMSLSSVLGSPGPQNLNDSDHQLLRDNIGSRRPETSLTPSAEPKGFFSGVRIVMELLAY